MSSAPLAVETLEVLADAPEKGPSRGNHYHGVVMGGLVRPRGPGEHWVRPGTLALGVRTGAGGGITTTSFLGIILELNLQSDLRLVETLV